MQKQPITAALLQSAPIPELGFMVLAEAVMSQPVYRLSWGFFPKSLFGYLSRAIGNPTPKTNPKKKPQESL